MAYGKPGGFGTWALIAALGVISTAIVVRSVGADWRTASRESAGIAPNPHVVKEAVAQVYAARAYGWRGAFGVHTWIAVKPTGADTYTVYQIIGWRAVRGMEALVVDQRPADQRWFGSMPELLADVRGPDVDAIIARIDKAARTYPHNGNYTLWPGPNSNSFVAHVGREVPELRLDLPPTAIGKDYLPNGDIVARTPSGTGWQISLFGLLGVLAGAEEGFEVNVLGLTFGINPFDLAIKLPIVGRIAPNPPVEEPVYLASGNGSGS